MPLNRISSEKNRYEAHVQRSREIWNDPQRLRTKTRQIREGKSFELSSEDKGSSEKPTSKSKLVGLNPKSIGLGPRIILNNFTDVRGVDVARLVKSTHFNILEVALMLEIFTHLTKRNSKPKKMTQYLELHVLRKFLIDNLSITDDMTLFHLVNTISDGKTQVSPVAFVKSFSTILRGTLKEKAKFVFRTYDEDKNGYLTKMVEFMHLMIDIFDVNVAADHPTADPDQPLRDTTEYLLKKFDKSKKGEISFDDFFETIKEEPLLLECCFTVFPSVDVVDTFERIYLCPTDKETQISFL